MGASRSAPPRTRLASKIDRVLATALGGDPRVTLDVKASEMLADPESVAQVISAALERAGTGLAAQLTITEAFRRSGLEADLVNSLADPSPGVRMAGARICGALRLPDAVPWLADLLDDTSSAVREVAVRALGQAGGRRVVEALISRTVLMACGLRGDALRTPLLVRMAQDRKCDIQIRVAACRAVAMIGDPAGANAMRMLGTDPDELVRKAAVRARMRISASMRRRSE